MRTFRTSLKRRADDNIIRFIETPGDFIKVVRCCISNKSDIRSILRLPGGDEKGAEVYVCAPNCHIEITPYKVIYCDRHDVVRIHVLIDSVGHIKGWY